jgi:hypothetical protein
LSYDERHELRHRVSDRLRDLVPYVEGREGELDHHIDRMISKSEPESVANVEDCGPGAVDHAKQEMATTAGRLDVGSQTEALDSPIMAAGGDAGASA